MTSTAEAQHEVLDMPARYFERTSPEEQARHRHKLASLSGGELRIEPIQDEAGDWLVEIVTMDWEEPGLLDKIFEAILKCIGIPGGVSIKQARIFTGPTGQVVNLLALRDAKGESLTEDNVRLVLEQLRGIQRGERGVLDSIQHIPFTSLIPLVTAYPTLDNAASPHYTFIELRVARLSNRFTSVLLHFLARSALWLNIQVAEFEQGEEGRYAFYVVDKHGAKLPDSHHTRRNMVTAVQSMNALLTRFNVHYVTRAWRQRQEQNRHTLYHSRPDPRDFLADLEDVRRLAGQRGFENRLGQLVEHGLLDQRSFFLLKRVEGFVQSHGPRILAMRESAPDAEDIQLCREYFELRRRGQRILTPLFNTLLRMESVHPPLDDRKRLLAMCHPHTPGPYALDSDHQLYLTGWQWLEEPVDALDPFVTMARTACTLREDATEAVEAALEGWTAEFVAEHREAIGKCFGALLDESIRQGTTAHVLRHLRSLGVLQRYVPGFARIQDLVHVVAHHQYTVDEHTFVVIEALSSLRQLGQVLPKPGKSTMRADYERVTTEVGLKHYAGKYASEMRILGGVTLLQSNVSIRHFLQLMDEVRQSSLDYLVDVRMLEYSFSTCMDALSELERIRRSLAALIRLNAGLPFEEQRVLALAGLFHDLRKPAKDHAEQVADELDGILDAMGLAVDQTHRDRVKWLIRTELNLQEILGGGAEGPRLAQFAEEVNDFSLLRALLLFSFADRLAVRLDQGKNIHDAMVLTEMLDMLERLEARA